MSASPSWGPGSGGMQDLSTGLVWGLTPGGSWSHNGATNYSANLVEGGYDDWRLPTKNELLEASAHGLRNNHSPIGNGWFWSSTTQGSQYAWAVNVNDGISDYYYKTSYSTFSPVRGLRSVRTYTEPNVRVFSQTLATSEVASGSNYVNFTVALDTQPTANVTVPVTSTDTSEGTVGANQLVFTPSNWNVPQWVRVTSVDDTVVDRSQTYFIDLGAAQSSDPHYSGRAVDDITVTNADNDVARVTLTASGAPVTSEGGTAAVQVKLSATPQSSPVYVFVSADDASEATGPAGPLVFDATNWNVAQTAVITGVSDGVADGDVKYNVTASVGVGSSSEFLGVTSSPLRMTTTDVDGAVATHASGSINRAIPDRSSVVSQIVVPAWVTIGDLNVAINVMHTSIGQLRVTLIGPDGRTVTLVDRRGGNGDHFTGTVFDDEAATSVTTGSAPFNGTFRPQSGLLSQWDGLSAGGVWQLRVEDTERFTTGTLLNWSLSVRALAPPPPPLDATAIDFLLAEPEATDLIRPRRTRIAWVCLGEARA